MLTLTIFCLFCLKFSVTLPQSPLGTAKISFEEKNALDFVTRAEKELHINGIEGTKVAWAYASNITDHNEKIQLEFQVRLRFLHFFKLSENDFTEKVQPIVFKIG